MACNNVLIDQLSTQLNQRIMKMIIIVLHTAKCKYIVHLDIILVSDWILSRLKSSDPMHFCYFLKAPFFSFFTAVMIWRESCSMQNQAKCLPLTHRGKAYEVGRSWRESLFVIHTVIKTVNWYSTIVTAPNCQMVSNVQSWQCKSTGYIDPIVALWSQITFGEMDWSQGIEWLLEFNGLIGMW